VLRHQTAVEAPGSLPCYPQLWQTGVYSFPITLQSLVAVTEAAPALCEVLWGRTPAFPQGQTMQSAPETFHPPVHLTSRHLVHCTPLCSLCPVGKLLRAKLSTEGLSLHQMKKYLTGSYLVKLFIFISLALQDILKDQFLLLPVTICLYNPEKYSLQSLWMLPLPVITVFACSCLFLLFSQSPLIVW